MPGCPFGFGCPTGWWPAGRWRRATAGRSGRLAEEAARWSRSQALVDRWVTDGLLEAVHLRAFSFGGSSTASPSGPAHQLTSLAEARSPENKSEALAFAVALQRLTCGLRRHLVSRRDLRRASVATAADLHAVARGRRRRGLRHVADGRGACFHACRAPAWTAGRAGWAPTTFAQVDRSGGPARRPVETAAGAPAAPGEAAAGTAVRTCGATSAGGVLPRARRRHR